MSIRLDVVNGQKDAAAGLTDREQARARQEKWMLEVERAMWAGAARPAPQALDMPAPEQTAAVREAGGGRGPEGLRADLRAPTEPRPTLRGAAAGAAGRAAAASSGGEAPTTAGASSAARTPADMPASAQPPSAPTPAASAVPPAGTAPAGAAGAALSPAAPRARALMQAAAAGVSQLASGGISAQAAGVAAAANARTPASPVQAGTAALSAPGAAFGQERVSGLNAPIPGQPEAAAAGGEPGAGDEASSARGPARPRHEASEPYARRKLHLVADAEGVHAWIRDAALDTRQARAVAQAVAAEMFRQGAMLVSVSVNGRAQAAQERSSGPGAEDLSTAALFDSLTEPVPSRKPARGVTPE
jgi:hypothetical protein